MDQSGKNNPAYRHGHTNGGVFSPTYYSWATMMCRCYNPNVQRFYNYGGRGIRVCRRWHRFENFLADMGARPKHRLLDRIDSNKGYNKNNCRWATRNVQATNRRKPIADKQIRRILRLCRKPKRLVDLPDRMPDVHFETIRTRVRKLVAEGKLLAISVTGNRPKGKTLLLRSVA